MIWFWRHCCHSYLSFRRRIKKIQQVLKLTFNFTPIGYYLLKFWNHFNPIHLNFKLTNLNRFAFQFAFDINLATYYFCNHWNSDLIKKLTSACILRSTIDRFYLKIQLMWLQHFLQSKILLNLQFSYKLFLYFLSRYQYADGVILNELVHRFNPPRDQPLNHNFELIQSSLATKSPYSFLLWFGLSL